MRMTPTQRILGNWILWITERLMYLKVWIKFGRVGVTELKARIEQRKAQLRYRSEKSSTASDTSFEL
jgi:hypothetical protein